MAGSRITAAVHPTAIIEPEAQLGDGVEIGAYAVVGAGARLGDGVRIHSHVVVGGRTEIGAGTEIFPFSAIGLQPQDIKYDGEASRLVIGERNVIREHVTMNPGTRGGGMETRIGHDGLFMVGVHVAHDCRIGDHVIMANNVTLGGHVAVGDYAVLGGLSAVHQFVRIGRHAMVGGMSGVDSDVIPFGMVKGERAALTGLNLPGLRRRAFPRKQLAQLQQAYDALFLSPGPFQDRLEAAARARMDEHLFAEIVEFIRADSERSICQPRDRSRSGHA